MNRRQFLQSSLGAVGVLLFFNGKLYGAVSPFATIKILYNDLFPPNNNLPTITSSNAIFYLENVILKHSRISKSDKEYILNGVQWLNEEALELYKKSYISLDSKKRQKVLESFASKSFGENWLYTMMSYMFEAILGDPIYGINKDELGWSWLGFKAGLPRPKKAFL